MISRVQLSVAQTFLLPPTQSSSTPAPGPSKNPSPRKLSFSPTTLSPQLSHRPNTPFPSTQSPPDSGLLFRQKLLYLENHLNVNPTKALEQNPNFRIASLASLKSVELCLSSMGLERSALGRILDMHPQLLTFDPHADLYPIFDFLLNEVQIPFCDIRKSLIRCPRLLVSDLNLQLRPTLRFLHNLGFIEPNAITCHTTLLLVSSVEFTLLPKIEYLQSLGLSYEDVTNMVLRSPGLLTYSIQNNLMPKFEYFIEQMEGDVLELKKFPQYFSFSLERKIKPRHRLLIKHGFLLPLSDMLKVSDGELNVRLIEMRLKLLDGK